VKREDIKLVFDRIKPDVSAKERMFENILNYSKKRKGNVMLYFNFKKAVPALALVVIFAVGILSFNFKDKLFKYGLQGDSNQEITREDMIGNDSAPGKEDMAAPLLNQFQIGNRHYILMSDYVEEFGFPATISEKDIGQKLTTIEKSPDESLVGRDVFTYLPAGCEAVVAVKRNNEYELFRFHTFESYMNNQDEDAIEYLNLYGIEGPEDIAKIQFIVHNEKSRLEGFTNITAEITDRNEIAKFYDFYSVLKNSSDKYFEKLFGNNKAGSSRDVEIDVAHPVGQENKDSSNKGSVDSIPPVYATAPEPSQSMIDQGETGSGSVAPSQGSSGNALDDPVTIRIYNQNGVYYESSYYKNIGFISRYEITAEFADFIENYIK